MAKSQTKHEERSASGVLAGNLGEPIRLENLMLAGVSAEAARGGQKVRIWRRLSITSDEHLFYRVVEGFASHIEYIARQAGQHISLARSSFILLVIHPDNTGELWLDAAAVALKVLAKRPIEAGTVVFERDIADVTAMSFPLVEIGESDSVVCIFREGWKFGLFFDFNADEAFSIEEMERDLGTLHRRLKYSELYDAIANPIVLERLLEAGWFPFVEILGQEFKKLVTHCEAGFDLDELEPELIAAFGTERVEAMFARWLAKPHFAGKEKVLRSALRNFTEGDPVAVLKIVLTEIEGILNSAYRKTHGKGAKRKKLLEFAIESAEKKAGHPETLLFPTAFAKYLDSHTFASFDPVERTGKASSRHAVGHGEADEESYTQVRALQALLTLDQLAFYT